MTNKDNPFMDNIINSGVKLKFGFSLNEFENIPIVFVLYDNFNKLYLCICTEIRQTQQWIATPITAEAIRDMMDYKTTIYDALMSGSQDKCLADYNYRTKKIKICKRKIEDISKNRLPEDGIYLEFMEPEAEREFELLCHKINEAVTCEE